MRVSFRLPSLGTRIRVEPLSTLKSCDGEGHVVMCHVPGCVADDDFEYPPRLVPSSSASYSKLTMLIDCRSKGPLTENDYTGRSTQKPIEQGVFLLTFATPSTASNV